MFDPGVLAEMKVTELTAVKVCWDEVKAGFCVSVEIPHFSVDAGVVDLPATNFSWANVQEGNCLLAGVQGW